MATAPANKRIINEVTKLKGLASNSSGVQFLLDKSPVDDPSSKVILGRILPKSNIYNQAAFQIEIKLVDFPFKAPEVCFVTPIYHPNVDDKGKICVDIVSGAEAYKPNTPLTDIVTAVANLIDNPNIEHALNAGKFFIVFF